VPTSPLSATIHLSASSHHLCLLCLFLSDSHRCVAAPSPSCPFSESVLRKLARLLLPCNASLEIPPGEHVALLCPRRVLSLPCACVGAPLPATPRWPALSLRSRFRAGRAFRCFLLSFFLFSATEGRRPKFLLARPAGHLFLCWPPRCLWWSDN